MLFSHDTEHSLACIVDLVNSAPSRTRPATRSSCPTSRRCADFVVRHDISEVGALTDA